MSISPVITDFEQIKNDVLPSDYPYTFHYYDNGRKSCKFQVRLPNSKDIMKPVEQWINAFKINISWTLKRTRSPGDYRSQLDYGCVYGKSRTTAAKVYNSKSTGCGAKLGIKAYHSQGITMAVDVTLTPYHNHFTENAAALARNRVSVQVTDSLTAMFVEGAKPAGALKTLKRNITEVEDMANRAKVPDYKFCNRLYHKVQSGSFGNFYKNAPELLSSMKDRVDSHDNVKGKGGLTCDGQAVYAFVTPVMYRAHTLGESGDICFLDSAGGMDGNDMRLFLLVTLSPSGGVPLGVFLTTSESTEAVTMGLTFLCELLGKEAFYSNGASGPQIFMTDDCKAEQAAIKAVFPDARHLLCTWHVLDAVHRWVATARSGIMHADRDLCYNIFRNLLYADTDKEVELLMSDKLWTKYDAFHQYVNAYYLPRQEKWAVRFRHSIPNAGCNTNNHVEAQFRQLKDHVMNRATAFNACQLIDILCREYMEHITNTLLDRAHSRKPLINIHHQEKEDQQLTSTKKREMLFTIATGQKPKEDWCEPISAKPELGVPSIRSKVQQKPDSTFDSHAKPNGPKYNPTEDLTNFQQDIMGDETLAESFSVFIKRWKTKSTVQKNHMLRCRPHIKSVMPLTSFRRQKMKRVVRWSKKSKAGSRH